MTALEEAIKTLEREIEKDSEHIEEISEELKRKVRENDNKRQQYEIESEKREKEIRDLGLKITGLRGQVAEKSKKLDIKKEESRKENKDAEKTTQRRFAA